MKGPLVSLSLVLLIGSAASRPAGRSEDGDSLRSLVDEARRLLERRSWEEAAAACRRLAAEDPDHPDAYLGIVLMQERRGDLAGAAALLDSLPGRSAAGRAYGAGLLRAFEGRLEDAAADLRRALALYRAKGHPAGEAATFTALGNVHLWADRPPEAAREYRAALKILESIGDRRGSADVLMNLAAVRSGRGDEKGALSDRRRAERTYEEAGDPHGQAAALESIGEALHRAGDLTGAAEAFGRAAALRRGTGDGAAEAGALSRLGAARTALGDVEEAETALERAQVLAEAAEDRAREADVLNDLAGLRFVQGEYGEALLLQTRALEAYRRLADGHGGAGAAAGLLNLGAIYHAVGEAEAALRHLREAVDRYQELGDRGGEAAARNNLGVALADDGRPEAGLSELGVSIRIRDEIGDRRGAAFSRYNAADALRRTGGLEEASRLLASALPAFREAGDRRGQAFVLNGFGELHRMRGEVDAALRAHREALDLALRSGLAEEEVAARSGIAWALERSGEDAAALEEYGRAIDRAESTRARLLADELKAAYHQRSLALYEAAVRLLARRSRRGDAAAAAEAFNLAERARARSLLDLLAEARGRLRAAIDPGLRRREQVLLARIASAARQASEASDASARARARSRLAAAEEALDLLEVEMRREAPKYADVAFPSTASLHEVRSSVLEEGEVLLEYFLSEPSSFLWIADRDRHSLHEIPGRGAIEAAAGRLLAAAGTSGGDLGGASAWEAEARAAARALLPAPLPGGARLVVVPDGVLHLLPFEALEHEGAPLLADHEVVYAPSASTFRLLRSAPSGAAGAGFLGVGDPRPAAGRPDLPPLPFSREEVERAAALFPPDGRVLLLGDEATERAVVSLDLESFRYVHFAAHGLADASAPRRSGILLGAGGGGADDGTLTTGEIYDLRLRAEVVTLSSCRSALGRTVGGEGIVGLARAFLYAGARSVVLSLWDVNDRSAADFMEVFYRAMREGRSPSAALREAKRRFIVSDLPGYRSPARWAPFVLIGEPGRSAGSPSAADRIPPVNLRRAGATKG